MQLADKLRRFLEKQRFGVLGTVLQSFQGYERVTVRMRNERVVANGFGQ